MLITPGCAAPSAVSESRLRTVLDLHFHPRHGSRYWLRRQEELGWDVRDRVRSLDDLDLLGRTPLDDLRRFPVRDFVPRVFHHSLQRFVVGETAGTTGLPQATVYRQDEFQEAFITPFLRVASATGFPRGEQWLWVGPSGPHIIGKVVRELARQTGSMDPFSVDFDPRWAKCLADGSLACRRYLHHVTDQALDVLKREEIGVLFLTPPALTALAARMTDRQRETIHGIHYGGLSISAKQLNEFRAMFPQAVHLSGYGNTLFGVLMEVADRPRQSLDYYPLGERVRFRVLPWQEGEANAEPVEAGQRGRVVFDRLDESCLLVGVRERDEAEAIPPSDSARALGVSQDGLRDPRPPATLAGRLQFGIY
jgi:phenylacetate-coenzyme A ligase PaaK-like adenylate-forming protein